VTEMNRIERAAEQRYFSFVHKQLTTNLCVVAKNITEEITKPQSAKHTNRQQNSSRVILHSINGAYSREYMRLCKMFVAKNFVKYS
jgi:hypothetical protein